MASTLDIGRVGLDFDLDKVTQWDMDENTVTVRGWIKGTATSAPIIRQQLLGYVDSPQWERAVPVVCGWDSNLTGFYRVLEVSVDHEPTLEWVNTYGFGCVLERVWNYRQPRVESYVQGVARTTGHSVTPAYWHTVPTVATGYTALTGYDSTRVGVNGSHYFYTAAGYSNTIRKWFLSPANWYTGSVSIKSGGYYVVGNQTEIDTDNFELSNGLVRVQYSSTGDLQFNSTTSAPAWSTETDGQLEIGVYNGGWLDNAASPAKSAQVLYNSPHLCVLRLIYQMDFSAWDTNYTGAVNVDLALKRGDRMCSVTMHADSYTINWGLRFANSVPCTALTGGMYQTSNDSDNNRLIILCADALTTSLTSDAYIYITTDNYTARFAVGYEYGGSGASAPEDSASIRNQWFASMTEQPRLVTS